MTDNRGDLRLRFLVLSGAESSSQNPLSGTVAVKSSGFMPKRGSRALALMQRAVASWRNMPTNAEQKDYVDDLQLRLQAALACGDERGLRAILRKSVAGLGPPRSLQGSHEAEEGMMDRGAQAELGTGRRLP